MSRLRQVINRHARSPRSPRSPRASEVDSQSARLLRQLEKVRQLIGKWERLESEIDATLRSLTAAARSTPKFKSSRDVRFTVETLVSDLNQAKTAGHSVDRELSNAYENAAKVSRHL